MLKAQSGSDGIINSIKSIFTKIIDREIPAKIVYEDDKLICIHDIKPTHPVHLLCIPKIPYINYQDFISKADNEEIIHFFKKVNELATQNTSSFRLITNNGEKMGQEIFHFHVHIVGIQ